VRHDEETLDSEKVSSSLTGTSVDVDRDGVVDGARIRAPEFKAFEKCDLTCITDARRHASTLYRGPLFSEQGMGLKDQNRQQAIPLCRAELSFSDMPPADPGFIYRISEQLMRQTLSQDVHEALYDISAVTLLGENRRSAETDELTTAKRVQSRVLS